MSGRASEMQLPQKADSCPDPAVMPVRDPQAFVSELIRAADPARAFSAHEVLERFPFLNQHRSCVIDLAYEEYCRLREAGDPVTPTAFASRYRDVQQSLHRVIEFDQILHERPSLIDEIPEERWPAPGQLFCDCRLLERIGRGVLSRVYVARQERLGNRRVVVKVCVRGEQEASLLGQLNHSAIASIHSIQTDGDTGLSLICMPYLTRVTLHHLTEILHRDGCCTAASTDRIREIVCSLNAEDPFLAERPESVRADRAASAAGSSETAGLIALFLNWAIDLASALEAAHSSDILHCDVKPGNVLLLPDLTVQLLDFNLAFSRSSVVGMTGGTMPYMAPEQLQQILGTNGSRSEGSRPKGSWAVTAAADVYGLAATLWHVVTGDPPFGAAVDERDRMTAAGRMLLRQQASVVPDAVAAARSILPTSVVSVLIRCLSFEPEMRPSTAGELADEFRALRDQLRPKNIIRPHTPLSAAVTGTDENAFSVPGRQSNVRSIVLAGCACCLLGPLFWKVAPLFSSGAPPEGHREAVPSDGANWQRALQLLQERQYRLARNELEQTPRGQWTDEMTFLDWCCVSLQLAAPPYQAAVTVSDRRKSEPYADVVPLRLEETYEWNRVIAGWRSLPVSGDLKTRALVNAAAMCFEYGDFDGVDQILSSMTIPAGDCETLDRIRSCLRLLDFLKRDAELDMQTLRHLRGRPISLLSRTEAIVLILSLARILSDDPDLSGEARSNFINELRHLVSVGCRGFLEPGAVRTLLYESGIYRDAELNRWVTGLIGMPSADLENRLHLLLLLPSE